MEKENLSLDQLVYWNNKNSKSVLSLSIIRPSIIKSDIFSDVKSHEYLAEERIMPVDTTSKHINNIDFDHLK